jgi:hypothetical protein
MSRSHPDTTNWYRQQVRMCGVRAERAHSGADGERLMQMRAAYPGRAATEAWLEGVPPANVCALAAAR